MKVFEMAGEIRERALDEARLYGILDLGYVEQRRMEDVARQLLDGGVGVLQLRAKGHTAQEVEELLCDVAPGLVELCKSRNVPFIINDYPEVAAAVGADGVHIGQQDGTLADVRDVVGDSMLVGRSTHSIEQARAAKREGFNYIGYGPLFLTPTKEGRPCIGLADVAEVQQSVGLQIPVFCIGGIKPENLQLVLASGAHRVVIVSALLRAEDVSATARRVLDTMNTEC